MAIKVSEVVGGLISTAKPRVSAAEDFSMINHPGFFARNVKGFLRLEQVLVQADDSSLSTMRESLTASEGNPLHWYWREFKLWDNSHRAKRVTPTLI